MGFLTISLVVYLDSGKQTLYLWKLLATTYPQQFRQVSPYRRMRVESPQMPLREYLGLVQGDASNWATVLTMPTTCARVTELVAVAAVVKNVVALGLYAPTDDGVGDGSGWLPATPLSDRVLRTWSELAQSSTRAFAHLRVLSLCDQKEGLSRVGLRYLRSLPALRVVLVLNCPGLGLDTEKDGPVEDDGWVIGSLSQAMAGDGDGYTTAVYRLYDCYEASFVTVDAERTLSRDTPVLDFQLGWSAREGAKRKRSVETQPTALIRSKTVEEEARQPETKKPRLGSSGRGNKAVMRNRGKDMAGLLKEFF